MGPCAGESREAGNTRLCRAFAALRAGPSCCSSPRTLRPLLAQIRACRPTTVQIGPGFQQRGATQGAAGTARGGGCTASRTRSHELHRGRQAAASWQKACADLNSLCAHGCIACACAAAAACACAAARGPGWPAAPCSLLTPGSALLSSVFRRECKVTRQSRERAAARGLLRKEWRSVAGGEGAGRAGRSEGHGRVQARGAARGVHHGSVRQREGGRGGACGK